MKHVEVGNVDYLAGLEADRFDVVWVFSGWDALRASDIEHTDIDQIRFADHFDCIPNWYTPLFITSEEMIGEQPELVRAFMDVTARGYELAIDDPERAAELMLDAVPEMDEQLIEAAADYYAPKFKAERRSRSGRRTLRPGRRSRSSSSTPGCSQQPVDVDDVYTNDFVPK